MSNIAKQQKRQVRLLLILLGLIFIVVGAWFTLENLLNILQYNNSGSWNKTSGQIINSKQVDDMTSSTQYCPKPVVKYQYVVEENLFTSRRIDFSKMTTCDRKYTKMILKNYPTGKEVTVFYNPLTPQEAVLQMKGISGAYVGAILGVFFVLIGGALVYFICYKF